MNYLYSTVNTLRDKYTPVTSTSTFRKTGQITPEEFVAAGDYLVFKFPTWSWADASPESKRVSYLPPGKQFLVTRNVPCNRRVNDDAADIAAREERLVETRSKESRIGNGGKGVEEDDEDGWLNTGGGTGGDARFSQIKDVREMDDAGNVVDQEVVGEEDDIPDMEDEDDDEAIIREVKTSENSGRRTYNLYIMYSTYYRTPRIYMSGYAPSGQPLAPVLMMDDIVGDYKDKTVTLEDFPFFANNIKMASIHPCKHASVMKTLLDRADEGLRARREKLRLVDSSKGPAVHGQQVGMEGLVDEIDKLDVRDATKNAVEALPDKSGNLPVANEDWEEVDREQAEEVAIRVDQYLVVFLKFVASVTPGIQHDFTMAV